MKILSTLLLLVLLIGCSNQQGNYADKVQLVDKSALDSLIKTNNKELLLVNAWATWCGPCKEEFPDLNKIAKNYENSNIKIIGISADYADELNKVKLFLNEQNAAFPNYLQNFAHIDSLINALNPDWSGGLPATFIYDKTGKVLFFHMGKMTFEDFEKAIKSTGGKNNS